MAATNRTEVICYFLSPHNETVECNGIEFHRSHGLLQPDDGVFWVYIAVYLALVLFAGQS